MSKKNRTTPIGKPQVRNTKITRGDCFNCGNCNYYGDGDSYCNCGVLAFVIEDWCPTDEFMWCSGKNWIAD